MTADFVGELLGSRELGDLASRIYRLGDGLRARLVSGPLQKTPSNTALIFFFGRCFKTYQAAVELLRVGFWQDAGVLARVLREAEYQVSWIVRGGDDTARLFLEDHQRRRRNVIHILAKHGSAEIKTKAEAMVEDTPDKQWPNWWSKKRDEGIGWLARQLERKAHPLEYARLSDFVHTSAPLADLYFREAKNAVGVIVESRPGVSEEHRDWANTVAFSVFAAFVDACGAFAQQMGFDFRDELTQINQRITE